MASNGPHGMLRPYLLRGMLIASRRNSAVWHRRPEALICKNHATSMHAIAAGGVPACLAWQFRATKETGERADAPRPVAAISSSRRNRGANGRSNRRRRARYDIVCVKASSHGAGAEVICEAAINCAELFEEAMRRLCA